MSVVGSFPGFAELRRRTVRGPINPLDKSTIVSIYPKDVDEVKHTIQPGRFFIKAGRLESPSILVVGPSSWWKEIDPEQPLLEIPCSSIQIADSIIKDYCNGLLASNMGDSMPGMFYVPGEYDLAGIKKNFPHMLEAAAAKQKTYYITLVRAADALWARSQGNPLAISDEMRMAARELTMTDKDWMKDFRMVSMVRCFACGSLKNPEYPVCMSCKVVDKTHPKAKDLNFIQ